MPKNPEVDAWFKTYDNPQKATVQKIRQIILGADRRMNECIKWQSPTFTYQGNLASFNPRSRSHASLLFHTGAKIPGKHPDLVGGAGTSKTMKIANAAEAAKKKPALVAIVKAWIELQDGSTKKKAPAKKKASKTRR